MKEIPKAYQPQDHEDQIYKTWEDSGYFNPDNLPGERSEYFSISMPPPNRTGVLHTGHATMLAYQDIMIRLNRLQGKNTLWLPGTDHAAIATQAKVEKDLFKEEGKTRHDLGKEKFLEKVVEFAEKSGKTINNQVRKMGSSCDWSRERYTLDEGLTQVVKYCFLQMYQAGVIYRGYRIVNWCPHCLSTLSDDEVEYKETKAKFYTFKYDKDFPIAISTTRPETKLGDTAVAVNPKDDRYKDLIGKTFKINLGQGVQEIKIVADESVDKDFGTGALGVTPAHSMIDYQIAQKNGLPLIQVIGEDGKMTADAGKDYAGLEVLAAREKLVEHLRSQGVLSEEKEIDQNLTICYRCGTTIEPLPSLQWFVDVSKKITLENNQLFQNKSIKEVALELVKERKIQIIPQRFEKDYFRWLENLQDWCISRQIWFGHQIPVWYRPAKIDLFLARHGQTDWNKNGIMQGQQESELNEKGIADAKSLIEEVRNKNIELIITSPLKRTKQTVEHFNVDNIPVIEDARLMERCYGECEGLKTKEVLKIHPEIETFEKDGIPYWIEVPGTETYDQVKARVKDFLDEIKTKYGGKRILVVSHGDTLDMFYALLNNVPNDEAYGQFSLNVKLVDYQLEGQEVHVGLDAPDGEGWTQDPDTLDTWFSSGLWTFSTLMAKDFKQYDSWQQWVKNSPDLKFHPTTVMETGYDILFFWVARMIIQTSFMMGEIPFANVYLHGLVLDEKGKKMSKSKGNAVDPVEAIGKYGTDALRLAMISGTAPGADSRLYDEKIEGGRNFVNKLWNISRYILTSVAEVKRIKNKPQAQTLADQWILTKLELLTEKVSTDLKDFNFSSATESLRDFTWKDFADWYLELSKLQMADSKLKNNTEEILLYTLEKILILWHPVIPFVTEVIWQNFKIDNLIIVETWPEIKYFDQEEKNKINSEILFPFWKFEEIVMNIRNLRAEFKIEPAKKVKVTIIPTKKDFEAVKFEEIKNGIMHLARLEQLELGKERPDNSVGHVLEGVGEIYVHLGDLVDLDKEKNRIENEIDQVTNFITGLEKKLANKDFADKAPEEVINKEKQKLIDQQEKLKRLKELLENL